MFTAVSEPRKHAQLITRFFDDLGPGELQIKQEAAEHFLLQMGITFNVYGDPTGSERIFPFDIVPRVLSQSEWDHIERGLEQRVQALNLFLDDVYHDKNIVADGVIPRELITSASGYRPQCE